MTPKEKLYRLLYLSLLEIRAESNENNKKIFEISNLIHNLPLKLQKDSVDYESILSQIIENANNNKGLKDWLKNNSITT